MRYKLKNLKRILSTLLICTMVSGAFPNTMYTAVYAESAGNAEEAVTSDEITSGVSLMYDDENAEKAAEIVSQMTLEQKIAQMIMPSFRYWENNGEVEGVPVLNDEIRNCIKSHGVGGVIVFSESIENTEQTVRLIDEMQNASVSGVNLNNGLS